MHLASVTPSSDPAHAGRHDSDASDASGARDPRASLVLLSYARPTMLAEALAAAVAQTVPALEVIVVDNLSPRSDEIARVVGEYPGVRLVQTGANLGFATGMNVGLREARGDVVLLTEDDMVLAPDALEQFVAAYRREEGPALFSGIIRDRDTGTIWFAGGSQEFGTRYRSTLFHRGLREVDLPVTFESGYLTGAIIFGAVPLLRALGGYREEYFMYWEDNELCLRARHRGVRLLVVRDAVSTHFTPPAGGPSPLVEYHNVKNLLATYLLHAPVTTLPAAIVRYGVLNTLRSLRRPGRFAVHLRALGWIARRLPRLLGERRRLGKEPPALAGSRTRRTEYAGS